MPDMLTFLLKHYKLCWGLDKVRPLKTVPGSFNHIFIAIDKFTKWIDVKPLVKTTGAKAAKFFDEIIHRFGVPHRIITDLGSNFTGSEFFDFCEDHGIEVCYVSVTHPRANGQVEHTNRMILQGLKARLYEPLKKYGGKWVQELPAMVWGLRTQPSWAIGQPPFFFVYGSEAVLPVDVVTELRASLITLRRELSKAERKTSTWWKRQGSQP